MRRVIRQYIAEFGPLNLFADALAIVSVLALIGMAFAFPTNAYGTALSSFGSSPSVSPVPASITFAGETQ